MAAIAVTYTFSNGTTADASQVNQNFTDIINGLSDGTKDISVSAGTFAGNVSVSGNTTLGNATSDDVTITGSIAATINLKTTNSYDIGTTTIGLRALYFGANSQTVNIKASASMSSTYTLTLPVTVPSASNQILKGSSAGVLAFENRMILNKVAKTTTYTATSDDDVISVDASGGSWTLSLPAASTVTGKVLYIVRTDQTLANAVTIDPNSTETINGSTTRKLATRYESYTIQSDGSNWLILDHYIDSNWVSFTPTGTWVANTTYTGFWKRVGDSIQIQWKIALSGAPTAANLAIDIPANLTLDTTKLADASTVGVFGHGAINDASGSTYENCFLIYSDTNTLLAGIPSVSGSNIVFANISNISPVTFASPDYISFMSDLLPVTNWEG